MPKTRTAGSTQYTDDETDLVMYLRRPYNPSTGRFLTRDPIQEKGGLNLYCSVENDPVNLIDPLGLKPAKACTIGGQPVSLTFDGKSLAGNGLNLNAVSGRPISESVTGHWKIDLGPGNGWVGGDEITKVFDYSYARQGIKNVGPIPTGAYWFEVCEERSFLGGSVIQHGPGSGAWGSYSWSLHPEEGTDTRGRGGFFIHGGVSAGSAGCIDIGYGDSTLHGLMKQVRKECGCCYVSVNVAYSISEHSVTERVQTWSRTHIPIRP